MQFSSSCVSARVINITILHGRARSEIQPIESINEFGAEDKMLQNLYKSLNIKHYIKSITVQYFGRSKEKSKMQQH